MGEMKKKKIAVIGAGKMGGALAAGLVRSGLLPAAQVTAVDVVAPLLRALREEVGVETSQDAAGAVAGKDVILLALRPQHWQAAVSGFGAQVSAGQLVISIMAGVRTGAIEAALADGVPVVRAMPNILAQVGAAVSALCPGRHAGAAHIEVARQVLETVGETVVVEEAQMDAVTGLSGSGPAYVYAMIDALADGGVKVGLTKDVALKLAAQTLFGAAKMALESGEHPAVLKDRVTSPGGTTIAGLYAMEQGGFRAALMAAVEAATRRSEELGK